LPGEKQPAVELRVTGYELRASSYESGAKLLAARCSKIHSDPAAAAC